MNTKTLAVVVLSLVVVISAVGIPSANAWGPLLTCSPSYQYVPSGVAASFSATGGDGSFSWYAAGGYPSSGWGPWFTTTFYTGSLSEQRTITVTSAGQSAQCMVTVNGSWTPTPTPVENLTVSPTRRTVDSNENVEFTAYGGDGSYSWTAGDGNPSYGWGQTFTTRFTNYSAYNVTEAVTVQSGSQTASARVTVRPYSYWTPTPTPYYGTLYCNAAQSYVNSGDAATFNTYGGTGTYDWYTQDGTPSSGNGSQFVTRFNNYSGSAVTRTVTVMSGSQSAQCSVTVAGYGYWTPTPAPYPYANLSLDQRARNVSAGQTAERQGVTAKGDQTIQFVIHIKGLTNGTAANVIVSEALPAGIRYAYGSATVNGDYLSDSIIGAGVNIGALGWNQEAIIRFSATIDPYYVPSVGSTGLYATATVRADNVSSGSDAVLVTVTNDSNAIAAVSKVQTGPMESALVALLISIVATLGYAIWTRTEMFNRRFALARLQEHTKNVTSPNFLG